MLQSVIQTTLGTNQAIGESLASHIGGPTSPTPSIDSDSLSGGMTVATSGSSAIRSSVLIGSGTGNISCDTNSDNVSNGSRSESSGLGSIGTATIIGSGRPLSDGGNGELGRPNVGRSASSSSTASSSSSGLGSSPLGCRASSASSLFTSAAVAGVNGGGLVQHPGSSGGSPTGVIKCWHCCNNFDRPKVLHGCFHTFCEPCLEKIQDHPEKITCPQCSTETMLGNAGISGLLSDFGIFGMIESSTVNGEQHIHSNSCTSCKTRESTAVARCLTCSNFLCPNCVTAHQEYGIWRCTSTSFACNTTVEGPTSKQAPISRPTSMVSSRFNHLNKNSQTSNGATFRNSSTMSEDCCISGNNASDSINVYSNELTHGLETFNTLSSNNQRSISTSLDEVHPNHNHSNLMGPSNLSSYRNTRGNIMVDNTESQHCGNSANILANGINGIHINSVNNGFSPQIASTSVQQLENIKRNRHFNSSNIHIPSSLNKSVSNNQQHTSNFYALDSIASMCQNSTSQQLNTNGNVFEHGLSSKRFNDCAALESFPYGNTSNYEKWSIGLNSVDHSSVASTSKMHLFGNGDNVAAAVAAYGASLNSGSTSGASNSIHSNAVNSDAGRGLTGNNVNGQNQLNTSVTSSNNATAESIMELSTKMLQVQQQQFNSSQNSQNSLSTTGSSTSSMFPPKSQIKRQKMIYHCKFGEFGVLEGQFTEPSGVAVNAQNDIIVADTNNHRIQIFDKEGRFKFQFGECGKRDGQLLYPNRVAAVRASGDIIVTERSPTHQVQIYNQYGQFVRKFGANILQHPRGVCVDNKGRIIVVECKVMRVIIFDQMGNVLNKFGCSKHLEFPNGVVVNDRQEIFISDNRAHCVKVFNYEGTYLRQIGGEGLTNYPIGVGINGAGEVTIADNHNNFNLSVFSQEGQLLSALESKVKHAQCFDVALMDDGSVVLASKDYRLYIYRYVQLPPMGMLN